VEMELTGKSFEATVSLPYSARPSQREAVAIWVTDGNLQPIQATGGWLPTAASAH
jgi:hypothetical protein